MSVPGEAAERPSPGLSDRLSSLTTLRGFAAIAVVSTHLSLTLGGRFGRDVRGDGQRISELGWISLSYFFCLSGFLLTLRARPQDTARAFYRRRFARIYPAYLAALVLAAGVGHWVEHIQLGTAPLVADLFLVQSWVPQSSYYYAINHVGWSLSAEAFFYLTWPFLVPRLARLETSTRVRLLAALIAAVIAIGILGSLAVPGRQTIVLGGPDNVLGWFVYICPLSRLPEFLIGATLATLVSDGWRPRWTLGHAAGLVVIVYAVGQVQLNMADLVALPFLPAAGLVLAAALHDLDGRTWRMNSRWWVWLGGASYCIYLIHELAIRVYFVHEPYPSGAAAVLYCAVIFSSAATVGGLLFRYVERPAERALRGRSVKRGVGVS